MVKIKIKSFRCWKDLELDFPDGKVTLLKGNSGVGKSTILSAIVWCLYGVGRNLAPNNSNANDTSVELTIGKMTFVRAKHPNRFAVYSDDKCYEDKVGQSLVNELYGSYEIWVASCYIAQDSRNIFLTSSNTNKMELLNRIAYHEEEPGELIEKISNSISEITSIYKLKQAELNEKISKFNELSEGVDFGNYIKPDEYSQISEQIKTDSEQLEYLLDRHHKNNIQLGIISQLENQINSLGEFGGDELTIPENIQKLFTFFNAGINDILSVMDAVTVKLYQRELLHKKVNFLCDSIGKYSNHDNTVVITPENVAQIIKAENVYQYNLELAAKYGVPFNKEIIQTKINEFTDLLSAQEILKLVSRKNQLQNSIQELSSVKDELIEFVELNPIEIPEPEYSQFDTTLIQTKIKELTHQRASLMSEKTSLQKSKSLIMCPGCKISLRYHNHQLCVSDLTPFDQNLETQLLNQIKEVEFHISQLESEVSRLNSQRTEIQKEYHSSLKAEHSRIESLKQQNQILQLKQHEIEINKQNRLKLISDQTVELENITKTIPQNGTHERYRILTPSELESIRGMISTLKSIDTSIEPPKINSQWAQEHVEYLKLLENYSTEHQNYITFINQIEEKFLDLNSATLSSWMSQVKEWLSGHRIKESEINQRKTLRDSIQRQLADARNILTPDVSDEIESLKVSISRNKERLQVSDQTKEIIIFHDGILVQKDEVIKLHQKLTETHQLLHIANETECHILEETVTNINYSLNNVLEEIFTKNISVALKLFKQIKSSKVTKPRVNFKISHNGNTYDDINEMSGGEKDRISLALTFAFNRLSGCPILIFDESLKGIENELRSIALETVTRNNNITTIVVQYDGVEGIFDNIVRL